MIQRRHRRGLSGLAAALERISDRRERGLFGERRAGRVGKRRMLRVDEGRRPLPSRVPYGVVGVL